MGKAPLLWLALIAVGGVAFYAGRATAPGGESSVPADLLAPHEFTGSAEPARGPMLHPTQRPLRPAPEIVEPAPQPAPTQPVTVTGEGDDALVHVPEGTLKVVRKKGKHLLVRHGEWTEKHGNGKVKLRAAYVEGKLDGVYRSFFDSGALRALAQYKNGLLDGTYQHMHENGQTREEKQFVGGKPHGRIRSWHPNGVLAELGFFEMGAKDGLWTARDENGTKRSEARWRMGQVVGDVTLWDETGALLTDAYMEEKAAVNGKYRGLLRRVHVPRDKQSYGEFKDYGHYGATSYGGEKDIPAGYWVYVYPRWYIWAEKADDR